MLLPSNTSSNLLTGREAQADKGERERAGIPLSAGSDYLWQRSIMGATDGRQDCGLAKVPVARPVIGLDLF